MRQRTEHRLPDRCDIIRREQTGTGGIGGQEPIYDEVTVAESVPCAFDDSSTSFVREETGERVQRPATIRVTPAVDVQEGDRIEIDGRETAFEVQGLNESTNHRTGRRTKLVAEVERA